MKNKDIDCGPKKLRQEAQKLHVEARLQELDALHEFTSAQQAEHNMLESMLEEMSYEGK